MTTRTHKQPYTVPCASSFRDAVTELADTLHVNVADLARSILLVMPIEVIRSVPDPGGPPPGDREETLVKSGPSAGKVWRRKPRLQVRLTSGYDASTVRRAFKLALRLNNGALELNLTDPQTPSPENKPNPELYEELERLRNIVSVLAFDPLKDGISTRAEARHVLGFAPSERPDKSAIRARFRTLATIHHPDSNYGSNQRMSQLNAAMELLNT